MRLYLSLIFGMALATAPPQGAASEIPIGFANPLTGPFSLTGELNHLAVEMAVRDLNETGGVLGQKITLIAVDDACGVSRAVAAARKLVDAGVRVVVGHGCSHSSLLAAGIYEAMDVLMITPSSTHPRLTEEGRQNVFRLIGRDDTQGELAGDFLAERFARRRIAILHDGSTYGEGLAREARQQLRARGDDRDHLRNVHPGGDGLRGRAASDFGSPASMCFMSEATDPTPVGSCAPPVSAATASS